MAGGRPTDYKPEYCQEIIDFFANNPDATVTKFAKSISVNASTIFEWADNHSEFSNAKKKAFSVKREYLLDKIESLSVTAGDIKVNSVPLIITARHYGLKTSDKEEDTNANKMMLSAEELAKLSAEELQALKKAQEILLQIKGN